MRRHPSGTLPVTVLTLAAVALYPTPARADLFGADTAALSALIAQGASQLQQAVATLNTVRQTYDETRRYVGMARDAVDGFNAFRAFADSVVHEPTRALGSLLPGGAYLARDLQSPQAWGAGTGELQRLVTLCLSGSSDGCALYPEAVAGVKALAAIHQTYGTSPCGAQAASLAAGTSCPDAATHATDVEAARSIKGATEANARAALASAQAAALLEKCTSGTDSAAMQACQSAANTAQVLQMQQTALLNEQLAEANRLKAVELAAKNGESKRAAWQTQQRQELLERASDFMAPPRVRFAPAEGER